jgi:hypothetical protein
MAFLTLGKLRLEEVIIARTHVAARAGVLHHLVVRAGLTFNTFATGTEQEITLNAQVGLKRGLVAVNLVASALSTKFAM